MTDPSANQDRLRRALDAIRTLKARVRQLEENPRNFAIVGASCRLPGASGLEGFDELLVSSTDPLEPIPEQRWSLDEWCDENPETKGRTPVREGGFIQDIDLFDASYFGIAPREARVLDPQHRLLLEVTIEALEHAGVTPPSLAGTHTGVFLGISTADHRKMLEKRPPEDIDAWVGTGNVSSTAAGRLSYLLDLQGPSLALDTACSSSLVAVHLACQSLASGESSTAIAGGVQVLLDPEATVYFSKLGALSPSSRCRSFSEDADGYVRSEGVGVVILKRLEDAERDGDPILAVIRGSAVGQDGRSNGLTAPNPKAQSQVIRAALKSANASPEDIRHIECHATGTPLGDPIEVEALTSVFGQHTEPITLGALKSRIGHCEAAAGIAGLLAGALVLSRQRVPRNLHLNNPSPHIPWAELPFVLPGRTRPWTQGLVGVSSFGFGGTNAHIILGPPPEPKIPELLSEPGSSALALSADSEQALREMADRWSKAMTRSPDAWPHWVHTALHGRTPRAHTLIVNAADVPTAKRQLDAIVEGGPIPYGEWPEQSASGVRIHAPPTPWSPQRYWAIQPPSPHRTSSIDLLEGCRWKIVYVPCPPQNPVALELVDTPLDDSNTWAKQWLMNHREGPRPLCIGPHPDAPELCLMRALANAHPSLQPVCVATDLQGSELPDLTTFQETVLRVQNHKVTTGRLRPATAGPSKHLSGQEVVVVGDLWLEEAAASLGGKVMKPDPNRTVDTLITQRPVDQEARRVVVVIGWDGWLGDDPEEAVQTAKTVQWAKDRDATCLRVLLGGRGLDPLEQEAREQAVAEALAEDVWVANLDAQHFFKSWPARRADPFLADLISLANEPGSTAPSSREELVACIMAAARLVLGVDAIEEDENLRSKGMDSVMALELRSRLERALGRSLPPTVAMDHASVKDLVNFLSSPPPIAEAAAEEERLLRAALAIELDEVEAVLGPLDDDS